MALIGPDDDITIGRPIRNVFNLIMDEHLQLVPVRVPGELLIGGVGVARGYQNLPDLTNRKFILNPLGEGPDNIDPTGLLDFLRDRLPKQMVPELVVLVADFLYTALGKLDHHSLPSVDHLLASRALSSTIRSDISAPQTDTEEELRRVWGQILQLDPDRISATDHFFQIGGDFISAILLLAQHTEKTSSHQANGNATYQKQVEGKVAMTPIQCWFSTIGLRNPHHFIQSFTLKVNSRANLSLAAISDALVALANHHDILRARCQPSDDGQSWVQTISTARAAPTNFLVLEETVVSENYADFILQAQSSLNLTTGPVLAVALIHDPDRVSQSRLFITIHHILLDDYAATQSADIWLTQVDSDKPIPDIRALLPLPELDITCTQAARLSTSFKFDSETTQSLLFQLAPLLRVSLHGLLLATFTQAFATAIGLGQVTFCMEGHSREPWLSDQDITQTVGWFTALYPLVLWV
ncbi:hypothetical protein H4R33_006450 [Dimargaris cristalligena]|nr:hypothetical protein H4R33_006450 [Dimargaris cristalligena]